LDKEKKNCLSLNNILSEGATRNLQFLHISSYCDYTIYVLYDLFITITVHFNTKKTVANCLP